MLRNKHFFQTFHKRRHIHAIKEIIVQECDEIGSVIQGYEMGVAKEADAIAVFARHPRVHRTLSCHNRLGIRNPEFIGRETR